jgi:6-phosphogluconolactonase
MIEAEWHVYHTPAEMADAVAQHVGSMLINVVKARGEALLAMPGGKSPTPIFRRLADSSIDWQHVTIIPTDDRVVPFDSPLSNYATIASHFVAKGAHVVPVVVEAAANYRAAGSLADAQLADLTWPPDLVWLGMGIDGHIASIIQGPDLEDALAGPSARRALGLMPCPLPAEAPVARVTLSGPAILSARSLLLTITGPEKRAVVERALNDGSLSGAPIGRVLANAKAPIDIRWSRT